MRDRLASETCAERLKALAEPDRLRLIQCLQGGPKNVSELTELLGAPLANVSHHLRVLRNANLVTKTRQGKFAVYALHPDVFRPCDDGRGADTIDLGCCRLELTGR
jgi:ArsR family transcriptional regulator